MPVIDLHCHTTASDGLATPEHLVRVASERKVDVIGVTDHDTVAGVRPAVGAGERSGVRVVAGIEISTRHDGREIHLLGYFVDVGNATLTVALTQTREQRRERAVQIVQRLCELGLDITMADVEAHAGGDVIARPHIARALVARGHVRSVRDAFDADLIGDGGRAFVPRRAMTTVDSIDLVRSAGGVAVVAHPGVSHHEGEVKPIPDDVLGALAVAGVTGLEVDHPDHPPLIRDRLGAIADEYGLVRTGGSDWHGLPEHTLGGWTTSDESFRRLEELARAGG
ncbi:MAG: PHP domain-containing protein [Actinomycetota bacterium]